MTQNGLVAPDIFKHRRQRPEAKAKPILIYCVNINNVKTIFEEKNLALVRLHTARAYLRLCEMFCPAGSMGLPSCQKSVSRKDLKILKSRLANTMMVAVGSVPAQRHSSSEHGTPTCVIVVLPNQGWKNQKLCWSCPDQGNGCAARARPFFHGFTES